MIFEKIQNYLNNSHISYVWWELLVPVTIPVQWMPRDSFTATQYKPADKIHRPCFVKKCSKVQLKQIWVSSLKNEWEPSNQFELIWSQLVLPNLKICNFSDGLVSFWWLAIQNSLLVSTIFVLAKKTVV